MPSTPPETMTSGIGADLDEAALEVGRLLFAQSCDFIISATNMDQLPSPDLPEIAFAGRSNVGKSSLINALVRRTNLARTSNTPGRTREINFFRMPGALMLVDLPGYGYAAVPKSVVRAWTRLIFDYLQGRAVLRRLLLLIDARHGIKPGDRELMALLDKAAVSYQAVLTKTDKLTAPGLDARLAEVAAELTKHPAAHPEIVATSARKRDGIDELRRTLAALASKTETG